MLVDGWFGHDFYRDKGVFLAKILPISEIIS
jgi:hypothetical protein